MLVIPCVCCFSACNRSWVLTKQPVATDQIQESNETGQVETTNTDNGMNSIYLENPDFDQQEFFDWLAEFTEASHKFDIPLTQDLFEKINNLEKSISNMLANPEGFIQSRGNFNILLETCDQLRSLCRRHLVHIMELLK